MMTEKTRQNILITGATGGLGLALVPVFIKAGHHVVATGRNLLLKQRLEEMGATFTAQDLTNDENIDNLCDGVDTVIHAAALSSNWGDPDKFQTVNIDVTQRLLAVAKNSGCKNFIYISSPSIYASMQDRLNIKEADLPALKPLNCYASSKLKAEQMVLAEDSNTFRTAAIRPRAIIGPDDTVLLPHLMEMANRRVLPLLRDGQALVELTDVRDVAQSVLLMFENINNVHGQAINISGGKPVTVRQLSEKIFKALDKSAHFVSLPMLLAIILANISEWIGKNDYHKEPKLTRYTLATMAYSQTFDMAYAREKLGFTPQYDAVETLLNIIKARRQL